MRTQSNGKTRIGDYEFDSMHILGKGATGNVYKGYRTNDGTPVAIKAIDMANVNNEVTRYLLEGQKKAMKQIRNPYVVKALDLIQQKDYCYIVMEECPGGTLKEYIQLKGKLSQNEALGIFRKIVHGYCQIINCYIIHRDLKPANIMLNENKDPIIIDFGYCEMIMGKRPLIRYNVGSPSYMSPQAYVNSRYSEKSDVWALGVILYQMLTGSTLDKGLNIKQYFENLKDQKVVHLQGFSGLCQKLLQSALVIPSQERATCHRLKYLIDINMGGPLLNPEGIMKVKPENIVFMPQTPMRKQHYRQSTQGSFQSNQHSSNLYLQSGRKSSLNQVFNQPSNLQFSFGKQSHQNIEPPIFIQKSRAIISIQSSNNCQSRKMVFNRPLNRTILHKTYSETPTQRTFGSVRLI